MQQQRRRQARAAQRAARRQRQAGAARRVRGTRTRRCLRTCLLARASRQRSASQCDANSKTEAGLPKLSQRRSVARGTRPCPTPPAGLCQRREPCADSQSAADHCPAWGGKAASRRRCLQRASSIENMLQALRTGPAIRRTRAASGLRVVASLELRATRPTSKRLQVAQMRAKCYACVGRVQKGSVAL